MDKLNSDNKTGVVFNIQRFSIHDGPGIRTLVFTKGCPLRCKWCSNPEGLSQQINVLTDHNECIGCGRCINICPVKAISLNDNIGYVIDRSKCTNCLKCAKTCPSKAKTISGERKSSQEIIELVKRDRAFYKHSNGGLTLGGGELLMQPQFSFDLLNLSMKNGINTAIETSGFGKTNDLLKIASVCNVIHYDLKAHCSKIHKNITGVDNQIILENLKKLDEYIGLQTIDKKPDLIIRIPLIKNYNTDIDDLKKQAQFILENIKNYKYVEVLPFHNFGENKYQQLDIEYEFLNIPNTAIDDLYDEIQTLKSSGLRIKVPKG